MVHAGAAEFEDVDEASIEGRRLERTLEGPPDSPKCSVCSVLGTRLQLVAGGWCDYCEELRASARAAQQLASGRAATATDLWGEPHLEPHVRGYCDDSEEGNGQGRW